jgi:hypothetical protein
MYCRTKHGTKEAVQKCRHQSRSVIPAKAGIQRCHPAWIPCQSRVKHGTGHGMTILGQVLKYRNIGLFLPLFGVRSDSQPACILEDVNI